MDDLAERLALARPLKSLERLSHRKPLGALVFRAEGDHAGLTHEGSEDDGHLNRVRLVQVEGLHRHVVESRCLESGFLTHFAERRILGLLTRLDVPVDSLPGRGTARVLRSLENEDTPAGRERTDDVYIDGAYRELRHGGLGQ